MCDPPLNCVGVTDSSETYTAPTFSVAQLFDTPYN